MDRISDNQIHHVLMLYLQMKNDESKFNEETTPADIENYIQENW